MAASQDSGAVPPQFILTPQQQNLLYRALTSNQPNANPSTTPANDALSLSPASLQNRSPALQQLAAPNPLQESPFLDYDYDLGVDNNFDFDFISGDQAKMIGDLPGTSTANRNDGPKSDSSEPETNDKRSHPDNDEDADEEGGGGKRRESEGKTSKKPGRKPLTNEPTTVSSFVMAHGMVVTCILTAM